MEVERGASMAHSCLYRYIICTRKISELDTSVNFIGYAVTALQQGFTAFLCNPEGTMRHAYGAVIDRQPHLVRSDKPYEIQWPEWLVGGHDVLRERYGGDWGNLNDTYRVTTDSSRQNFEAFGAGACNEYCAQFVRAPQPEEHPGSGTPYGTGRLYSWS
jgi:hypothetical protein